MSTGQKPAESITEKQLVSWRKTRKSIVREFKLPDGTTQKVKCDRTAVRIVNGVRIRELPKSGSEGVYYRVEVPESVAGKRTMRQFQAMDEADAYARKMVIVRKNSGLSGFALDDGQRSDATRAIRMLEAANCDVSLVSAVAFYLEHARPSGGERTIDQAFDEYLRLKQSGRKKKLRERTIHDIEVRLNRFAKLHGPKLANTIFPKDVESYLDESEWSPQTRLNEWMVLHGFFKFCHSKKYCASNPVADVEKPHVDERSPELFTAAECRRLLGAALDHPELELGPALALGLFAGIRSEELTRLSWSAVKVGRQMVTIGPEIAKKRRIRNVALTANAIAWLAAYGIKEAGLVLPSNSRRRWDKLCAAAGIDHWKHNGCRHTFASCHYALHQNAALTCDQLGQATDAVLFNHYRSLMDKDTAREFFNIIPPDNRKIVPLGSVTATATAATAP